MSDYKRFVSYIYDYGQGEKGENTGFVKVNARGGECKIWVHMKGFYSHGQRPYRVYVFAQKRERLDGHYLGELESRNGALEWNGVTSTESLMGGFGLDESRGIYIEGENRVFAAEWDDYPVDVDRFMPLERSARQASLERGSKAGQQAPRMAAPQSEKIENRVLPLRNEDAEPQKNVQAAEVAQAAAEDIPKAEYRKEERWEEAETKTFQKEEPRAKIQPEDPRRSQWEYLVSHFPAVRYQDVNGSLLSGIRLGSRELSRIPRDKWGLGNNSFLLHGFYQHHHLLLIRRQTETEVSYYIGVPGVYNEKEQMLASMFGFEEFKVMKGPEAQGESFGYWCRVLR